MKRIFSRFAVVCLILFQSSAVFAASSDSDPKHDNKMNQELCQNALTRSFELIGPSRYLTSEPEITKKIEESGDWSFESWAGKLKHQGHLFRGMVISPTDLKSILDDGLKVEQTKYDEVHVDSEPARAIDFLVSRFPLGVEQKTKMGIILVLDDSILQLQYKFGTTFVSGDIDRKAISEIWAFDPSLPATFPFTRIYVQEGSRGQ